MRFLLDTNVVSELAKPQPNMSVVRWLHDADEDDLFISVITLAELRIGVHRLAASARRERLEAWVREQLAERFESRILVVDEEIAEMWGQLMATSEARGRRMNVMDCFLAATAVVHQVTLVTRNVDDFSGFGGALLDPWTPA
ncbi:MAG: type II toxin-antitoxin system VapC family toxin [Candidatus Acidiferrum sp.]